MSTAMSAHSGMAAFSSLERGGAIPMATNDAWDSLPRQHVYWDRLMMSLTAEATTSGATTMPIPASTGRNQVLRERIGGVQYPQILWTEPKFGIQ